ncbi:MAG: prolyl oligopeptidase family serine peptidase [Planctomycetes bacterium]|nr:prolyl oligopeptidase family serine peptidase [Planctomycetota bacterium]
MFQKEITKNVSLKYLLYLPKGYGEKKDQKWPLLLFLHGAGERGDDVNLVKKHGPPKLIDQGREFPFLVVSPQCPANSWWPEQVEALAALLDEVQSKYAVDADRVYLTGLSMGGFGTWALACRQPERFAAIVPICGGGDRYRVSRVKNVPTWVFHGAKDLTVPLQASTDMVEALKKAGGNVQFTVYPEAQHDSWTETYNNPKLYEWLLSHRRSEQRK